MSTRRKPPSRDPRRAVVDTGLRIEAAHRFNARLPDPVPGQHMWIVMGMWRLTDPTSPRFVLDVENLLTIEGPGCFWCETPYSPEVAARPCPGDGS